MKTEEDEAFDELAKKQGDWGGGFPAKRAAAADKLQEPIYNITVFDNAYPKGIPLEDWVQPAQSIKVEGLLHVVCQCDKCKALPVQEPVQEPVAHFGSAYVNENGVHITTVLGPVAIPQDAKLYTTPTQRTWVGLTNEEIDSYFEDHGWSPSEYYYPVIKDIEAKLKEKNFD